MACYHNDRHLTSVHANTQARLWLCNVIDAHPGENLHISGHGADGGEVANSSPRNGSPWEWPMDVLNIGSLWQWYISPLRVIPQR
jgi:hypothetical protein